MKLTLPLFQDLTLSIADRADERKLYPSARLQKGLVLNIGGLELAEEAVGFGLPVLKQGLQTTFPGKVDLNLVQSDSAWKLAAGYTMNLVEKIARPGAVSFSSKPLYAVKNVLAAFIRQFRPFRMPLTALSSGLRRFFDWETTYEEVGAGEKIWMVYAFDRRDQSLLVEADTTSLSHEANTEVIVMNEQGANFFDQYRDSSGVCLSGEKIGCWDEVTADEAHFSSSMYGVAFSLHQTAGARLFRGRELIGSRLAWAGFGYSFRLPDGGLTYTVKLEKLP
jgi:hypothetical protein